MERRTTKRSRSVDDDFRGHSQTKVYVNQIMTEKSDSKKMDEVHEKTRRLLYGGPKDEKPMKNNSLCTQYYLRGDGTITLRTDASTTTGTTNNTNNTDNNNNCNSKNDERDEEELVRRISGCCCKMSLIHDKCINCTLPLCEECGYSCLECSQFICRSCVTLFGTVTDDRPMCERCQMFLN